MDDLTHVIVNLISNFIFILILVFLDHCFPFFVVLELIWETGRLEPDPELTWMEASRRLYKMIAVAALFGILPITAVSLYHVYWQ
ncbi:unnamed protein product [Somion occarium]|uniref:Uncharacterized protein n=1 Tax=Somion occarium TaxID=3059160 RepID=A0ABP1D4H9_9APHY